MATLEQLQSALVKADAAGNVDDARAFAAEIRTMRGAAPKSTAPQKQTIYNEDTVYDPVTGVPISSGGYGEGAKGATKTIADLATGVVSAPVAFAAGASRPLSSIGRMAGMQGAKQMGEATTGLTKGLAQANDSQYLIPAAELAGEIAGTAGAGNLLAGGLSKVAPQATRLAEALRTGGMSTGGATAPLLSVEGAKQLGSRVLGGAGTGAASAALITPEEAGTGAMVGAALPAAGKLVGSAASYLDPQSLMQSALKPTLAQLKSGEAQTAVDILLKYGINATKGGVEKLKGMAGDIDQQISDLIANSGKTIPKQDVLNALKDVEKRFVNQVSPTADMAAIQNVGADFAQHPMIAGQDIPVELAQELKKGTYKVLEKKYGQLGSAETEAQKGLARGLKEGIANAVPEVGPLNAQQSDIIKAMKVTGRRALMDENKNPVGLAGLAGNPSQFLMMMADKSALAKSLAARGINALTPEGKKIMMIEALRQGTYKGAPVIAAD